MANCRSESVTGPVTRVSGGDIATGGGSTPPGASHSLVDYNGKTVTMDYESADENSCLVPAEVVQVKGRMSVTFFVSSLDVTHIKWQTHVVIDGVGSMGNLYHGDDQWLDESNVSIFPFEWTIERNVSMHSTTAPDYRSKYSFHITISGTGEPTASVDKGPNESCSK
jgi:hypothetical protein